MLLVLLLCASGTLGSILHDNKAVFDLKDMHKHFETFLQTFNRQYLNEHEKQSRFKIFQQNLKEINKLNTDSDQHATFGITKFSDMSKDEFLNLNGGYVSASTEGGTEIKADFAKPLPNSFDWRNENAVTRVRDQKNCSSSWAISALGTIESQYAINNKTLLELSEQQIVDCDKNSNGCKGGDVVSAYLYMIRHGGVETENDYPYLGHDGACMDNQGKAKFHVTDYLFLSKEGMRVPHIITFMTLFGPLTMALDSSTLQFYKSGIITKCPENVDHTVLLIGYGSERDIQYFTMKNSYGENWGEDGYFRVKTGACGMLKELATMAH